MLKYKLFFLASLLLSTASFSQTTDSLVGNWRCHDAGDGQQLDAASKARLQMAFGDLRMDLRADKTYTAVMFKEETGTWHYDEAGKQLVFTTDKVESKMAVLAVTAELLTLELAKGKSLVFKKLPAKFPIPIPSAIPAIPPTIHKITASIRN